MVPDRVSFIYQQVMGRPERETVAAQRGGSAFVTTRKIKFRVAYFTAQIP